MYHKRVLQKLLRPPTITPICMGGTRSSTACRAHEPRSTQCVHKSRQSIASKCPAIIRTHAASLGGGQSSTWSSDQRDDTCKGAGQHISQRQRAAVRTVCTGGLLCRGYSRSPTGLRHRVRALPENTTEVGCATSSANSPVACVLPTVELPYAAAHNRRLPAPLRRGVIGLVKDSDFATT